MRVVIVGATGNAGTSLLRSLENEPKVESILAVARRKPGLQVAKTTWATADIASDDLVPLFGGADVVVHLAWLIQPSHNVSFMRRTNVEGSARLFEAAATAGVPAIVYASSVGAYSAGPKDSRVDESWPTDGIATSFYSRHKAEVERLLDDFERRHPDVRVVRLRPALIFKRETGAEVRRLFFGPLMPNPLLRRSLLPLVPNVRDVVFQVVHSYDIGEAYRLAIVKDVRGAFNVGTEPVVDPDELARILDARQLRLPRRLLRVLAAATWRLHLQPTPEGWVDMGLSAPLMDFTRARTELGWEPRYDAEQAILDLLEGLRDNAGLDTPPLKPETGGRLRIREFATGIGRRQ